MASLHRCISSRTADGLNGRDGNRNDRREHGRNGDRNDRRKHKIDGIMPPLKKPQDIILMHDLFAESIRVVAALPALLTKHWKGKAKIVPLDECLTGKSSYDHKDNGIVQRMLTEGHNGLMFARRGSGIGSAYFGPAMERKLAERSDLMSRGLDILSNTQGQGNGLNIVNGNTPLQDKPLVDNKHDTVKSLPFPEPLKPTGPTDIDTNKDKKAAEQEQEQEEKKKDKEAEENVRVKAIDSNSQGIINDEDKDTLSASAASASAASSVTTEHSILLVAISMIALLAHLL